MSRRSERSAAVVHVQRTADPSVLRWVTHDPVFARFLVQRWDAAGSDNSDAARFDGAPPDVEVSGLEGGDILLRRSVDWDDAVEPMRAAIVAARQRFLDREPSIELLQQVVDDAVGELAGAHGGRIEVVGVDERRGRVSVAMHGACDGCAASQQTLSDGAAVAIRGRFPQLTTVVEQAAATSVLGRLIRRR